MTTTLLNNTTLDNMSLFQNTSNSLNVLNAIQMRKDSFKESYKIVSAQKEELEKVVNDSCIKAFKESFEKDNQFKNICEWYTVLEVVQALAQNYINNSIESVINSIEDLKEDEKETIQNVYKKYYSCLIAMIKNAKKVEEKRAYSHVLKLNNDNLNGQCKVNKKLRVSNMLANSSVVFNQKERRTIVIECEKYIKEHAKRVYTESELIQKDYNELYNMLPLRSVKKYDDWTKTHGLSKNKMVTLIIESHKVTVISDDERKVLNKYNIVF